VLSYAAVVLATSLVFIPIAKGRVLAWLGLRHFFSYPPLWVALIVGFVVCLLPPIRAAPLLPVFEAPSAVPLALSAVGVGVLLVAVASILISRLRMVRYPSLGSDTSLTIKSVRELQTDLNALQAWLNDTRPVSNPDEALFSHAAQARRIASKLQGVNPTSGGSTDAAVILLGPRGSGKTTLGKLVQRELEKDTRASPRTVLCSVSAWSYQTPDALLAGLIDAVLSQLKAHVNVLGLTGLSSAYLRAARAAGEKLRWATELIEERSDPTRVLKRLEPILGALDLRIIVWLDDLERYADVPERKTHLNGVRALLDQFTEIHGISFVLASEDLADGFDLSKLGLFVERVRPLDIREVENIISLFRGNCLGLHFIDPASSQARRHLALRPDTRHGLNVQNPLRSLSSVLNTPRALKHSLRRTWSVWMNLFGEIDFDDVLIIDAIREQAPVLFMFINRKIASFRSSFDLHRNSSGQHAREEEARVAFHAEYQEALGVLAPEIQDHVDFLIRYVFPNSFGEVRFGDSERPQGFSSHKATDYWDRYLSEAVETGIAWTDQDTIKMIQEWESAPQCDMPLPVRLAGGDDEDLKFEQFAESIPREMLPSLLEHTVQAIISRERSPWKNNQGPMDSGEPPPGFVSIARMCDTGSTKLTAGIHDAVKKCLPIVVEKDLRLANDLMYWFGARLLLASEPASEELRDVYVRCILDNYVPGTEHRLVVAVDHKWVCTIAQLLWPVRDRQRGNPPHPEWKLWRTFCDVLLKGAREAPEVILPQIALALTESSRAVIRDPEDEMHEEQRAQFDEERARALFDIEELMPLLADLDTNWALAKQDVVSCREAQRYASVWLEKRRDSSREYGDPER
jgi:hypothetical protein